MASENNLAPPAGPPRLSWEREDIERKCGFTGAKYTGANGLFTGILGLALTGGFFAALLPIHETWFAQIFCARGSTQYATVFLAAWSLAILLVKWAKLRAQRPALALRVLPESLDFVLSEETAGDLLENIEARVEDPHRFLLLNRIQRSLNSLKNMRRVSDVDDVLRSQAEIDENYLDSTYTLAQAFIWAIPVLGFIGTVLGLSQAISAFGTILAHDAQITELKSGLLQVTAGLAVAFDTTLVALVAALVIHLLLTGLRKRENEFLDECDDYCHKNIVTKVRIVPVEETRTSKVESR